MSAENGRIALILTCTYCLIIMAFVSWAVPYSKGYQTADKDHQAAYSTDQSAAENYENCVAEQTTAEAINCYKEAEQTTREHQRAEQDLDAQREMANWAEGVLWATIFVGVSTTFVTALGVFFVKRTLDQGADINQAAVDAVEAANQANQIMRDERRPWITLRRDIDCDFFERGWGCKISWNHNFENLGKSPATNIRLRTRAIKTNDLLSLGDRLDEWISTTLNHPNAVDSPIIFPGEVTDYWRYYSQSGLSYVDMKTHVEGRHTILLTCITYQLGLSADEGFGVEGRVLGIKAKPGFYGPFGHTLLEYANLRVIR